MNLKKHSIHVRTSKLILLIGFKKIGRNILLPIVLLVHKGIEFIHSLNIFRGILIDKERLENVSVYFLALPLEPA